MAAQPRQVLMDRPAHEEQPLSPVRAGVQPLRCESPEKLLDPSAAVKGTCHLEYLSVKVRVRNTSSQL